jgi:hypothetical protein
MKIVDCCQSNVRVIYLQAAAITQQSKNQSNQPEIKSQRLQAD